jgi:hypothetical protein
MRTHCRLVAINRVYTPSARLELDALTFQIEHILSHLSKSPKMPLEGQSYLPTFERAAIEKGKKGALTCLLSLGVINKVALSSSSVACSRPRTRCSPALFYSRRSTRPARLHLNRRPINMGTSRWRVTSHWRDCWPARPCEVLPTSRQLSIPYIWNRFPEPSFLPPDPLLSCIFSPWMCCMYLMLQCGVLSIVKPPLFFLCRLYKSWTCSRLFSLFRLSPLVCWLSLLYISIKYVNVSVGTMRPPTYIHIYIYILLPPSFSLATTLQYSWTFSLATTLQYSWTFFLVPCSD